MDVVEKENFQLTTELSSYLSGQQSKQKDVPDIYPEPDSIHAPSQPLDLAISGSRVGEDKSGVRLQPLHGLENEDSQSVDTVSSTIQDRHPGNGTQVSIRSSEPVSTSPTLDSNYVITAPCSTSAPRNGDTGTDSAAAAVAAEMADVVEDTMRKPTVNTHRRPGVILLGRGNSFSLGRSEVIFLHNTKPYRRARGQKIQHQGSGGIVNNQDHPADPALHNSTPDNSPMSFNAGNSGISSSHDPATGTSSADHGEPSPPPLSNQVSHHSGGVSVDAANRDANWPITFRSGKTTEENSVKCLFGANYSKSTTSVCEERGSDNSDDLAALWARAELIMAGKQRAVLDVLEQFGVGESGEDTQQEEEEEESVWQVVENKTHAVDR